MEKHLWQMDGEISGFQMFGAQVSVRAVRPFLNWSTPWCFRVQMR